MPRPVATETAKAQRAVQSIEVGGRLLLALAAHPAPMALKDLAAAAGLPASRAHPYLVSFGRLGLVRQDDGTGRYALGPAALQMGLTCLLQLDPVREAQPVAEALARDTGHAVALAVWGNFGPTVVRMIEAEQPLHVSMRVGTVMSLLGTATGRAFAGTLPPARLALAAPAQPPAVTAGERRAIADDLARHGVVRAVGQPIPGVNAFSAPVFDHEGLPALVLTAMDHEDRLPAGWNTASATRVREAAAAVSRRLGGHAPGGMRPPVRTVS